MNVYSRLFGQFSSRLLDMYHGENSKYAYARVIGPCLTGERRFCIEDQLESLRRITTYAYEHTAFYRDRFDRIGFKPGDLTTFNELKLLPIVTKDDLIGSEKSPVSSDGRLGAITQASTSGTTGLPLTFCRDSECVQFRRGIDLALSRHYGWRCGEWQAWMWGASADVVHPEGLKARLVQRCANRVFFLDIGRVNDDTYAKFVDQIRERKPTIVGAYPSLAIDLAYRMASGKVPSIRVPLVVCSAEYLSDEDRSYVENVYADRCYQRYGAREFGTAGFECRCQDGYHLFTDSVYVETVPAEGMDGSVGKVIVTDLQNMAMPLIRYEVGDLGRITYDRCRCGLDLPRLLDLRGRIYDMVMRCDGSYAHASELTGAVRLSGIRARVQLVQEARDQITVNIESEPSRHAQELTALERLLRERLGEPISVRVCQVTEIQRSSSGKFAYVISHLNPLGRKSYVAREGLY